MFLSKFKKLIKMSKYTNNDSNTVSLSETLYYLTSILFLDTEHFNLLRESLFYNNKNYVLFFCRLFMCNLFFLTVLMMFIIFTFFSKTRKY